MNLFSLGFIVSLLLLNTATCQVQVPGKLRSATMMEKRSSGIPAVAAAPVYQLPKLDNEALRSAAEAQDSFKPSAVAFKERSQIPEIHFQDNIVPKAHPYQFAKKVSFELDMNTSGVGQWIENQESGTRSWRFMIKSEGALSLSLNFADFYLAPGSELYVYNDKVLESNLNF